MSYFNTQMICTACGTDERGAPGYAAAQAADADAIRHGDFNFVGVGLSLADERYLADKRAARAHAPSRAEMLRAAQDLVQEIAGAPDDPHSGG